MDLANDSSSTSNSVNQLNTNNRPGTLHLSQRTSVLSSETDRSSSISTPTIPAAPPSTPTTPVSTQPRPSTPTTPVFLSPLRTRIVTYTIPSGESHVSFTVATHISTREIHMAQINESDEDSE